MDYPGKWRIDVKGYEEVSVWPKADGGIALYVAGYVDTVVLELTKEQAMALGRALIEKARA